jgi:hypothetical protein
MSASEPASTPDLPITGGCGCGAVRFEVTEPLLPGGYCHCTRCQRRTGTAASINAILAPGSLRIVKGEDRLRAWRPEGGNEKLFCVECGSALFTRRPGDSDMAAIRLGSFDRDPGVRPAWRQFVAYAAPWDPIPDDGLPRYPERRVAG